MNYQTDVFTQDPFKTVPIHNAQWNPYTENGGTVLAIAGEDFCVIAGDTRLTDGQFGIQTRNAPKVWKLPDNILITANGYSADGEVLVKRVAQKIEWYHHHHSRPISLQSTARMIQTILYGNRFFPYYVHCLIGGLDKEGKGAVYSFDPVGSYEREQCRAAGAAASLIMPFLDNQVNFKNQIDPATGNPRSQTNLPLEQVLKIVKDAFSSATERHIEVGDGLEILICTKEGVNVEKLSLKKD